MNDRPSRVFLHAYVLAVTGGALAMLPVLPPGDAATRPWVAILVALLTGVVAVRPVHIPALRLEVTASHPFLLFALIELGPRTAGCAAVLGVLMAAVGKRARPDPLRLAFNLGAGVLCVAAAAGLYGLAGGRPGVAMMDRQLLPLMAASVAYFLANTLLVAGAIALEKGEGPLSTWRRSFPWTAASFFTGAGVAVGLKLLFDAGGIGAIALGIPPCWLLAAFYRTYRDRLEEHRRRLDEVERLNIDLARLNADLEILNTALEDKVRERTVELEDALARLGETNTRLRETNERLVQAGRAKSEFLANISHELRTPLNAILGFSDLLADPTFGKLSRRQLGFTEDIHESGRHLLELINDILDLSKIEAGKLELRREPVDVAATVRDVAGMLSSLAGKREVRLAVEVDDDLGAGLLDRRVFRQILVNLLSNALKFTPAGGRAEVRARRVGDDLVLAVSDTGIGIRPEDQERIFQEFQQVDGSYSREYGGTGLGLALTRRMMELHRGSVRVRSAPGRGSTFTCRFPSCLSETAVVRRPAPPEPERPEDRARRAGKRILVVEDEPRNRRLARNALRSRGFEVLEAAGGEQALEAAGSARPDLVLMDLQLPGMDGLEVTRRLKRDPLTSSIPVVALTAFVQPEEHARARAAGCVGVITKPIRIARLPAQIDAFLEAREGAA